MYKNYQSRHFLPNKLNLLVCSIALFSITFIIVYEIKFLFVDLVNEIEVKETEWNNLKLRLISSGFVPSSKRNLSSEDERIQKVTKTKVLNLFEDMKSQGLRKYLEDFYFKGEKRYSIVLSSWRSGSSFFGDFLQSVPGTFYHYEPLINNVAMIRPPKDTNSNGIRVIENFMNCNYYENSSDYFDFMKISIPVFKNSIQLGNVYEENEDIAVQAKFVAPICQIYPFQSMKVIRLELASFKDLLENNRLNAKIILLVRDPRAVMNSRRKLKFCLDTPDCAKPEILCQDMVNNYFSAKELIKKYPENLK